MNAKVLFFNSLLTGGASIAAQRLFDSIAGTGLHCSFYSLGKSKKKGYERLLSNKNESVQEKTQEIYHYADIYRYLNGRPSFYELFSLPFLKSDTLPPEPVAPPVIVHLHWVAGLIDYPSFFKSIPSDVPIVWTLHDMNPFTGGCHYSWECEKFTTHCHTCPQLNHNKSRHDLSFRNFRVKLKALENKNVHIVAGSKWIEQQAMKSSILGKSKSIQTIYCGLDTTSFYPLDKDLAKKALGITEHKFVICFGAERIENKRKGFRELIEALAIIRHNIPNALFLIFGHIEEVASLENTLQIPVINLGFINSPELLTLTYSAADIFIIPSIFESFGQTSLEAMACGTPVVGFNTGGIPEMVEDLQTGLLAETGNSEDLAHKIMGLYANETQRLQMGRNARRLVEEKFSLKDQTRQYLELYDRILN